MESFFKLPWPERRGHLLAELACQMNRLSTGQLPTHVSTDIKYLNVHFYRGKREIGYLCFASALHALVEDIFLWTECGVEHTNGEHDDLDIKEADTIQLKSQ